MTKAVLNTVLIRFIQNPSQQDIDIISDSIYDTIYLLLPSSYDASKLNKRRLKTIIVDKSDIVSKCEKIAKTHVKEDIRILFDGDNWVKLYIQTLNSLKKLDIDYKIFNEKDCINEFLGANISGKKHYKLNSYAVDDYQSIVEEVSLPFVFKPVDGWGSVSVFVINNKSDFEDALKLCNKKFKYLCEKYLTGDLYSFDFYFDGNSIYFVSNVKESTIEEIFTQDEINNHKPSLEKYKFFIPIRYNEDRDIITNNEPLLSFFDKLVSKLQSTDYTGMIHLEVKYSETKQEVGFIEWGARMGGRRRNYAQEVHDINVNNVLLKEYRNSEKYQKISKNIYYPTIEKDKKIIGLKSTSFKEVVIKNPEDHSEKMKKLIKDNYGIEIKPHLHNYKLIDEHKMIPYYADNNQSYFFMFEVSNKDFKIINDNIKRFILDTCFTT